jgi:hypothetical protein
MIRAGVQQKTGSIARANSARIRYSAGMAALSANRPRTRRWRDSNLERFPELQQDNSWQRGRIAMQMILGTLNKRRYLWQIRVPTSAAQNFGWATAELAKDVPSSA